METNVYPCRSNYFCKTEFKATHTHVHTKHFWLQGYTSFCIQHCSLKTTLHITLVVLDDTRPIWRYFFISPPIKILDKQSLPGTFFSVNMLSKIGRSDYCYHGTFIPLLLHYSIMEICWITTLLITTQLILTASICTNSKYFGNSYYLNLCCPANIPSSRLQSLDSSSVWSSSCKRADGAFVVTPSTHY